MSRSVEDKSANAAISADQEELEEKFDISSLEIAAPPFCWGENLMSDVSYGVLYPNCIINESGIVKKYQCEFCDYKTSYKGSLKKHIVKLHETPNNFKCSQCSAEFCYEISLQGHVKSVHSGRLFKCNDVNFIFAANTLRNLKVHQRRKHAKLFKLLKVGPPTKKSFQCDICKKRFTLDHNMRAHRLIKHENPKAFSCHLCDRNLCSKSSLQSHLRIHEEQEVPNFEGQLGNIT